eukprot:scaffold13253_cov170-Amphora_coffeaeformis.AAC.1
MAPIAAATLFRTLCIPADCPTITLLYPFSIAFPQPAPADDPFRYATVDTVDTVDAVPGPPPPARRPPSPSTSCPEDPLSVDTIGAPSQYRSSPFSGTSIASPAAIADLAVDLHRPAVTDALPHTTTAPSPLPYLPPPFGNPGAAPQCGSTPFPSTSRKFITNVFRRIYPSGDDLADMVFIDLSNLLFRLHRIAR